MLRRALFLCGEGAVRGSAQPLRGASLAPSSSLFTSSFSTSSQLRAEKLTKEQVKGLSKDDYAKMSDDEIIDLCATG